MTKIKHRNGTIEHIEHVSGREVTITCKNGVITVDSDAYNENFNTNK